APTAAETRSDLEDVALLLVIGDVETLIFGFRRRTQPDDDLDDHGENDGADDGNGEREHDRLELLDDERLADDVLEVGREVRVHVDRGEDTGEDRPKGAA